MAKRKPARKRKAKAAPAPESLAAEAIRGLSELTAALEKGGMTEVRRRFRVTDVPARASKRSPRTAPGGGA